MTNSPEHLRQYEAEGYLIADDVVEPDMLGALLEAAKRVKKMVRSGEVDVFTHWASRGEPWAIRGLFAPEFAEPVFAEYLVSRPVLAYAHAFLSQELRLGGVTLFTNPYHADYSFGWHRDLGAKPLDTSHEEELATLSQPMRGLRWHLALVPDHCLMIVPWSHRRCLTPFERECLLQSPHEPIPGQTVIELHAGQTVFWNGNLIHRGMMRSDVERLTLAGSWRKHSPDDPAEKTDPRLRWMLAGNVRAALPDAMRPCYDRWRALQDRHQTGAESVGV